MAMVSMFLVSVFIWISPSWCVLRQFENPDDDLIKEGDLKIGAVTPRTAYDPDKICGDVIDGRYLQYAHAAIFGIEKVNKDPNILPNITLGYVFLDNCQRQNMALSQSTKFIKMNYCVWDSCYNASAGAGRRGRAFYDVVAQILGWQSKFMVLVAALHSQHHFNIVSASTSEALADKVLFKYFTRTWPSDSNRARGMVELLDVYKWTYIATYGSAGSYGEMGMGFVNKFAREKGFCIAHTKTLHPDFSREEYDHEIRTLRKIGKVRVLVGFFLYVHMEGFLEAIGRMNASAEFIIIASEGFDSAMASKWRESTLNIISVQEKLGISEEFNDYYMMQNPFNKHDGNPWNGQFTPEDLGCTWQIPEGREGSCYNYKTYNDIPDYEVSPHASSVIDQVYVVAHGLHNLITDRCPKGFSDKSLLKDCITGEVLLHYIQAANFQGISAYMKFVEGQLLGTYYYLNIKPQKDTYVLDPVGVFDIDTNQAIIDINDVLFYDRVDGKLIQNFLPESVCAKPCKNAQFYIQGELACCWECRYCRDNEVVRADKQGCETCPLTTWPEPTNASVCEPIPPTYMLWDDPIAMGLVALAAVSIIVVMIINYFFYKHRERKVVKGSNKELMILIQLGLLLAYGSVFAFIAKPTLISCYINFFGFNVSIAFIFGPLFIKTNRLYRIFAAAEKCQTRVKMVDTTTVLMMSLFIIFIEIGITVGVAIYDPPKADIQMPVYTRPHVELLCTLPLLNLVIPLSFNILLLLLCAVYGFLARKLPDNFNESWYIFISVTTTLFVWIAFLPTYFLAFYSYHKAALLALALILNGGVTVLCLYSPKIYALYFIKEENIKVSTFDDTEFESDKKG